MYQSPPYLFNYIAAAVLSPDILPTQCKFSQPARGALKKSVDKYTWHMYNTFMPSKLGNVTGGVLMNREEILQASQKENKNKDLAEIEFAKAGIRIGWLVTVCLAVIVGLINNHVYGRGMNEMLFVVCAGLATVFFSKFAKAHKNHELFVAIAYAIGAIGWMVGWIIQLVK